MQSAALTPNADVLFAEAELRAERTVSLLRMLISAALGGVFILALFNNPVPDEAVLHRQLAYAAGTLSAYFALGVGTLLALRGGGGRRSVWIAWGGATCDVAFLLINLLLALENMGIPANYIVCLPPIFLAPLVLTFGALRFNPALQLYFLFLLTVGFVAVVAASEWDYGPEAASADTLRILLAPPTYAMRLAMLALAGVVLVIAAVRAKALLRRAIHQVERAANLTRYLPRQIADRLAETGLDELRRGRRQTAAVLFVDIRSFTSMSENMSPEALGEFLTEFRHRVVACADATGGAVDKFIGDAAMIVFGVDKPDPGDAAAALACAEKLGKEIDAWRAQDPSIELQIAIGAHWGEVFCGAIGDEARLEFTVVGDAVNVAARLQGVAAAADLSSAVSGDLWVAAGNPDGWRSHDVSRLRGRKEPIAVFAPA